MKKCVIIVLVKDQLQVLPIKLTDFTGNIIKSLLVEGLTDISKKNTENHLIDTDNFDIGENQMFLKLPDNISYGDAIDYILMYHICKDPFKDHGFLNYGRHIKKFTLTSLGKIFKEHEDKDAGHGIETLSFNDTLNNNSESGNTNNYSTYDAIFTESKILNFNINNPSGNESSTFLTNIAIITIGKPVNEHDINLVDGNLKNIGKKFRKLYVDPFKKMYGVENILIPNFDLNNNKLVNNSGIYQSYKSNEPRDLAIATINLKQLGALLFLQNTYNIELEGLTSRQSGKFIDIVNNGTLDGGGQSRWDRLHIGRHFITSVKHVITQDRYLNYIETIKPYRIADDATNTETTSL